MLAPCHSYLLTPSAPSGADRLIGSYCSTAESEEGKLWPLPCSLVSIFHFTACFSWALSFNSCWFSLSPLCEYSFILISQISLFHLPTHLLLVAPLCCSHFLSLILLSLPSPHPDSSPQCICHSHSPSLFISRLYVSVYPGLECHKQLGRSHSLLLHLLAWSPISLYRHCHLFYYIVLSLCLSLVLTPSVCVITFICPRIRLLS